MKELLKLARETIECNLNGKKLIVAQGIMKKYGNKGACFVTLTKGGELRGCIGSLEARQELYKDVIENATHAAFHDYRFLPLEKDELDHIKIEISVLTVPKKLEYRDEKDLLSKLNKDMGLILNKNGRSATFLPQVWEELPDKVEFLEHLARKAGLGKGDWTSADYEYYKVESVEEDSNEKEF